MTDADVALVSGVLSGLFNIRLPECMARAKQHCIRHRAAVQEMLAYLATRDVEVRAGGRAAHSHTELRRSGRSWSEAQQLTAAAGDALAQLRMALRAIMLPRLEALLEATGVRLGEPEWCELMIGWGPVPRGAAATGSMARRRSEWHSRPQGQRLQQRSSRRRSRQQQSTRASCTPVPAVAPGEPRTWPQSAGHNGAAHATDGWGHRHRGQQRQGVPVPWLH